MRVFVSGMYRKWSNGKDDFIKFPLHKQKYEFNLEYKPNTILEQLDTFYRSVVSLSNANLKAVFIEHDGIIDNIHTIRDGSDITIHYLLPTI